MFFSTMLVLTCAAHGQTADAALKNSSKLQWALHAPQLQGESLRAASLSLFPSPSHPHPHPHFHESPPAKTRVSPGGSASPKNEEPSSFKNHFPEAAVIANLFLMHLFRRDWEDMLDLAAFPFWLESKTYPSPQALREAWETQLFQKPLGGYEIRGIEVLSLEQMKERFGPPPERLNKLLQGRNTHLFAVANVSGRAVVLLLQPPSRDATFKVVAFHD